MIFKLAEAAKKAGDVSMFTASSPRSSLGSSPTESKLSDRKVNPSPPFGAMPLQITTSSTSKPRSLPQTYAMATSAALTSRAVPATYANGVPHTAVALRFILAWLKTFCVLTDSAPLRFLARVQRAPHT